VALGAMWVRIAAAAGQAIAAGDPRAETLKAELMIGRAFMERTMPETALRLARITAGADALMAVPEAAF
jgi:acyl-CoA dehydrogenase